MSTTCDLRISHLRSPKLPGTGAMIRATGGLTEYLFRACRWTSVAFPNVFHFDHSEIDLAAPESTVIGWHSVLDLPVEKEELIALLLQSGEFHEQALSETDWSFLMTGLNVYLNQGHPRITRKEISFYWPGDLKDAVPRLTQWQEAGHLRIHDALCGTDSGDLVIEMVSYIPG